MTSRNRPDPSPLGIRSSQGSDTFSRTRSSSNNTEGSFVGSVKQTAKDAMDADVPRGAWAAAAQTTAKAPTIGDIRRSSLAGSAWTTEGQKEMGTEHDVTQRFPVSTDNQAQSKPSVKRNVVHEEAELDIRDSLWPTDSIMKAKHASPIKTRDQRVYSSGWQPPPKLPWTKSWAIGLKAFGKWALTPVGFLGTLYCLNVVAWGGMLFLLLCGAAPEMCWAPVGNGEYVRDCNHIDSPRRIWLEWDSQILNALFCVTGFGLLPWRARDLYYLLRWRFCSEKKHGRQQKLYGLRKLAGFYKSWVRLPGSDTLDTLSLAEYNAQTAQETKATTTNDSLPSTEAASPDLTDPRLPLPLTKTPDPPLTGVHAPPTRLWKLDFYIWCNMWNTFFQACLCGFMWGMNRYDRPSWSTGFFIACACVIAAAGGIVSFKEGKKIKRVEGVNPSPAVAKELERMQREEGLELANTNTNSTVEYVVRTDGKGGGRV